MHKKLLHFHQFFCKFIYDMDSHIIFRGYSKREVCLGTEGAEDDIKSDFTEHH